MRHAENDPETPVGGGEADRTRERGRALDAVAEAAGRLRYGAIQLTVHDGRIVQLDVTERQRFT